MFWAWSSRKECRKKELICDNDWGFKGISARRIDVIVCLKLPVNQKYLAFKIGNSIHSAQKSNRLVVVVVVFGVAVAAVSRTQDLEKDHLWQKQWQGYHKCLALVTFNIEEMRNITFSFLDFVFVTFWKIFPSTVNSMSNEVLWRTDASGSNRWTQCSYIKNNFLAASLLGRIHFLPLLRNFANSVW